MNNKKINKMIVGAVSLIAATKGSATQAVISQDKVKLDILSINTTSLKSIESSWLKVPNICKARVCNASPISIEQAHTNNKIKDIYNQYA